MPVRPFRRSIFVPFLLAALLLLIAIRTSAQVATGDIVGSVTDSSNAVVPGAKVTATNLATGLTYVSNATSDGNYLITQLPAGHYRLTADKDGL